MLVSGRVYFLIDTEYESSKIADVVTFFFGCLLTSRVVINVIFRPSKLYKSPQLDSW